MNKIRVIDLLNKIANGEEAPKQIEYRANLYGLDEDKSYRDVVDGSYFAEDLSFNLANLSDEVQIIENQEDIDIQSIEEIEPAMNGNACVIDSKTWTLNQVIKAVKQLDKKIKEK